MLVESSIKAAFSCFSGWSLEVCFRDSWYSVSSDRVSEVSFRWDSTRSRYQAVLSEVLDGIYSSICIGAKSFSVMRRVKRFVNVLIAIL